MSGSGPDPSSGATAPAVPAATIVLARAERTGFEIFMVVRHHQIDFASGALVFPGGKIDAQDEAEDVAAHLAAPVQDPTERGLQCGAIREAFEESGVLLARRRGSPALLTAADVAPLEATRDRIHSGALPWIDFLREHDLVLANDTLVRFAHWITPEMMPRRFDTHFYLAVAPGDQRAVHDGHESVDSTWITPAAVLEAARDGRRTVIFPTLRNVELLAGFEDLDALVEGLRARPVVPVLPWTEKRADGVWLRIPPEAGYPVCEERMESAG